MSRRIRRMIAPVGRGRIFKAQPDEVPVLTPVGFRPINSLAVGDLVTCPDGRHVPVLGVFPQGERDIFRIEFTDGRATECCSEHLWRVWVPRDQKEVGKSHKERRSVGWGRWQTVDTAWLLRRLEQWDKSPRTRRNMRSLAIPLVDPFAIEYPPQDLPIPPYALGAILGDGCLGPTGGVSFSSADKEIVERVGSDLADYEVVSIDNRYDYRIRMKAEYRAELKIGPLFRPGHTRQHRSPLVMSLKDLGLAATKSHQKFIPQIYKAGSVEQRVALIQGLMDTDGSPASASAHLSTTSARLALDVQEIAWSLGAICKIRPHQTYYTYNGERKAGRPSWVVSMVHPNAARFFSLSRKLAICCGQNSQRRLRIKSITPAGRKLARCILVDHPSHLYVTNDYIVTHNTNIADALFEEMDKRDLPVTAWDIDKARNLKRRISIARRPADSSDRARRLCLEDAIHETIAGEGDAIVDLGADELLFHQIADKLPEMSDLLAEAGLQVVAIHVLGHDVDKDLAFYRATKDSNVFARQLVALNHGVVPEERDPDEAFAAVRRAVERDGFPMFVIRKLPVEIMEALWPEDEKAPIPLLHDLADDVATLKIVNAMVLRSYLSKCIAPIVNEILTAP
jgi:hypothetical protein